MILLLVFGVFFWIGWKRAERLNGPLVDKMRYGAIHAIAATLAVYAVATLGDWQGVFN